MSLLGSLVVGIMGNTSGLSNSLRESQSEVEKFSRKVNDLGKSITSLGADLSLLVTGPLVAVGGTSVKAAADFETAFAGVRKTVDATEEEFAVFRAGIREMARNMPQAATEIAAVAEAAGQLGIQNDAILKFTETMVNMGVATNLSSEQAAMALARFATITQMNQQEFDRLGSTIVALGNNLAATESEIVEMGLRIAGAGNVVGMAEHQILAFAGALAAVGINAEAGGTAFSKLMINIANEVATGGERLEGFARVAGMTAEEFQRAFEEDAASAIVSFIEGLGAINEAGGNVFGVLQDLGLTEVRLRDAILRSAGAGDVMRKSLELGAQAWKENLALTNEANERYKTFESQLQIFRNRLKDIAITLGDALIPAFILAMDALQPVIDLLARAAEWFTSLDPTIQLVTIAISAFAAALGPLLLAIGPIISSLSTLAPLFTALTGPVGATIAAVAALASGLAYLYTINEDVRNSINAAWEFLKNVAVAIWGAISSFIMEQIDRVKAFWEENGEQILQAVINVFNGIKAFIEFIMPGVQMIIEYVWEAIKRIFTGALDVIMGAVKIFAGLFTGDWSKLWEGVKQVFSGAVDVILGIFSLQFVGGIRNLLTNLLKAGVNIVRNMANGIVNIFKGLYTTANNIVSGMVNGAVNLFRNLFSQASNIFHQLRTLGASVWNAIRESILGAVRNTYNGVVQNFTNMLNSVRNTFTTLRTAVKNIWDEIIKFLKSIDLKQIGRDIMQGLINGIKGMAGAAVDAAKDVARGIRDGIKDFFGISSPSKLMMQFGRDIGDGLALGMESQTRRVMRAAEELSDAALVDVNLLKVPQIDSVGVDSAPKTFGSAQETSGRDITIRVPVHLDGEVITEIVSRIQAGQATFAYRGEGMA